MTKTINFIDKIVNPTCEIFVRIGGLVVAVMMFLTFIDVLLRYVFNSPLTGSIELTEFMMVILFSFSVSYTALKKGHIRVDFLFGYFSQKVNRVLDMFSYAIATILCILLCWQVFINGQAMYASKQTSPLLFIPIYPFIFLMVIGCALLVLVFIRDTLVSIRGGGSQ